MSSPKRLFPLPSLSDAVRFFEGHVIFVNVHYLLDEACMDFDHNGKMCKAWTLDPRTSECFILSSCEERDREGVVSGLRGCEVKPSKLKLYNRFSDKMAEVEISWQHSAVCPKQSVSVTASGFKTVGFYESPEVLDCGKASITVKVGSASCSASNVDTPTRNVFINSKSNGDKCVITKN